MVELQVLSHRTPVNPLAIDAFTALDHALRGAGYKARATWVYNDRRITVVRDGKRVPGGTSLHAYGLAVDIDAKVNPHQHGTTGPIPFSAAPTQPGREEDVRAGRAGTAFSRAQVEAVEAIRTVDGLPVFRWGGRWKGSHDAMHFEIVLTPEELRRGIDLRFLPKPPASPLENLGEGEPEGEWEDPGLLRPILQGSELEPKWEEEFGFRDEQADGRSHVLAEATPTRQGLAAATRAPGQAPRLRTALDSRVRVSGTPEHYTIGLDLDAPAGGQSLAVADYRPIASTPLRQLPIFIEDIATGDRAIVTIRRDPAAAVVTASPRASEAAGRHIDVRIYDATAEELQVAAAPPVRNIRNGVVVSGRENVTDHSSGSELDKIVGSIAPAEGGFASVEGSDRGIFTWGQGQWTVTGGELQKVMAFIKLNRRDLFDRYWGPAGLDISAGAQPVFVYRGRRYATSHDQMMTLFHSNRAQLRAFAEIFAQAGMDPQIQRLQREYMRRQVAQLLSTRVQGQVPDKVLNTRAKAIYYSMHVNGPRYALAAFHTAIGETPLQAGAQVTEAIRARISSALEAYFRNSGVVAWDSGRHHIVAFWGERGRRQALDLADQHIRAPVPGDIWSVEHWSRYREQMARRQSRYDKTASEITRALSHGRTEPDVPQ